MWQIVIRKISNVILENTKDISLNFETTDTAIVLDCFILFIAPPCLKNVQTFCYLQITISIPNKFKSLYSSFTHLIIHFYSCNLLYREWTNMLGCVDYPNSIAKRFYQLFQHNVLIFYPVITFKHLIMILCCVNTVSNTKRKK